MRIPSRYSPLLFSALLSAIMVSIVSAFVLATTHGIDAAFFSLWLASCAKTWPIAFPTVALVAPWVRRLTVRLTT